MGGIGATQHILFYEYVEDILERRGPDHRAHLDTIEAFVRADPYANAGLVASWRIERWNLV